MGIVLKSEHELEKMREAGRIVSAVLDAVEAACVPGVTTFELNRIAERELARAKARSAFLGYRPGGAPPYPAVLCTSVNRVVVHGIPSERSAPRGRFIGIDFACFKDGYCADAARTVAVGVISEPARALLETTRECLERAIRECVPGAPARRHRRRHRRVTRAERGFAVVRDFVGHGIGRAMHEPPRCRTTAARATACGCAPAWCWPSSRSSTPAAPTSRPRRRLDRRHRRRAASRRTSSTRSPSPTTARAC